MTMAAVLVLTAWVTPLPLPARIACGALGVIRLFGVAAAVLVAGVAIGIVAARRIGVHAQASERDADAELLAIDLIGLGVAGGLSFPQAVAMAASTVTGTPQRRLRSLQRQLAAGSVSLAGEGPIGEVARVAERSAASGAALGPGLDAIAESVRSERAAAERARLARLPVRLLFPLALLILPGFILLAVGPAVLSGLSRLSL